MKLSGIMVLVLLAVAGPPLAAQERPPVENRQPLLMEIAASINTYKTKTITLRLRLKQVDRIFEKIVFYDTKNHDIEFSISDRDLKKRLAADMLNVHQGLEYNVTFTVRDAGSAGNILADLKGFKPVILDALP
ncbi:MAG TPA: hypothetical protein PK307_12020 [Spirochaetota bacterium]|nr:hypothetical protein [Spirochaetota bacterium]HOD16687.1 hypothetical protein [Spirochaetota bacterium]HPG52519.1 hypothetical protein [Spirochaetota bacterium]HPN10736.1 hypothetical protein [Spirochaetota bacterium]HQL82922.1 hypothetical protein [Spirochaetota bacterium]